MSMEARRQQLGGIFPGYSGPALRRAMRSSRVRAKSSLHDSKCEEGTGCFELLAAVAGQFLQDSGCDAKPFFTKNSECDIPNNQGYTSGNELVAECNRESTFGADQAEKKECRCVQILCSSHPSPLISKGDVEEEVQVQKNFHPKDSVQYNSVFGKPLAAKFSQNQALSSMMGYGKYLLEDALLQGCTTEWEGSRDRVQPIAIVEDDGFSAKSDNESGTASVDCKEKSALQRQSGGRGNLSLNLGKQEPCRVNQVAHEYSLKDHDRQPEFRILSEDVLSNEMMLEQEEDFEEECSRLKRLDYEPSDCVEVVKDIQVVEETERKKCFSKFEQKEGFPGEGSYTFSSRFVHVNKEKENALLGHYGITSKCPNSFFRMEDEQVNASPLTASLMLKEQMQRIPNNEKNALGFCSFVHEKASHLKREVSDCIISKVRAKKCTRLRCENGYDLLNCHGGSGSCSKRKHVEMAFPGVAGGKFEKQSLYGETAYTRQRSSRVSKFRRKRTGEKEDTVPTFPLHHNNVQSSKYQCVDGEPPAAAAKLRRVKAASVVSSPTGRGTFPAINSSEPHVKVSIKSFTVPELFVDLPESATVADLKKAVMDAAMNILGGGLRVRVLLQGKKVPDEGATLVQLGISRTGKPESLGFMLEPTPTSTAASNFEDPLLLLSHAASQPSPRCATFQHQGIGNEEKGWPSTRKLSDTKGSSDLTVFAIVPHSDETNFGDTTLIGKETGGNDNSSKGHNGRELEVAANQRAPLGLQSKDTTIGAMVALRGQRDSLLWPKHESDSTSTLSEVTPLSAHDAGAIILHPRESSQQMAIVSMQQNNLLQAGKRRIRRPFSVGEVEALVLAVEKLGTGRWRDIKVMAFDQAKYRTYVDLKDKWKTLVHTAQIAPHQRRGEPVPQELLERVLHASSYWTAQQAKQQAEIHV